jgi:hypothetical protein
MKAILTQPAPSHLQQYNQLFGYHGLVITMKCLGKMMWEIEEASVADTGTGLLKCWELSGDCAKRLYCLNQMDHSI